MTVGIRVFGLTNLQTALRLSLVGIGPFQMDGGNLQVIAIHPAAVGAQGIYDVTTQIHATDAGTVTLVAKVLEVE
jgi:hypothetical protein